jgi:hypothetical protein
MPKLVTTASFIEAARKQHGSFYDYGQVRYVSAIQKVKIKCPQHGYFFQTPNCHLNERGCPLCGRRKPEKTAQDFLAVAAEVHGSCYDYSQVDYINLATKVKIKCPTHGFFHQAPKKHLAGQGCPKCRRRKPWGQEKFLALAAAAHPDYDYSDSVYTGATRPVSAVCPIHGFFSQQAYVHLHGHGCPQCGRLAAADKHRTSTATLVERFRSVHGSLYDYSQVSHTRNKIPVTILCRKHGPFEQHAYSHLAGMGCPKCGKEVAAAKLRYTPESFTAKAVRVHGQKYTYDFSGYENNTSYILITCPDHGPFRQQVRFHLMGYGCPVCGASASKGENELFQWVLSSCPDAVARDRKLIGLELDVLVPSKKIAIEYNGMYWHSVEPGEKNDSDAAKSLACAAAGCQFFVIWEDDWLQHRQRIEHWLGHKLGIARRLCGARECAVEQIEAAEANAFYACYHLQGECHGGRHWGLRYRGQLVAALTLSKSAERKMRFARNEFYFSRLAFAGSVPGGASRLFGHAVQAAGAQRVLAHSDNSYADGAVKKLLGFKIAGTVPPRYRIWHSYYGVRHRIFWQKNRIAQRIKELELDVSFNPKLMTTAQAHALCGCRWLWDCGKTRWEWVKT